MGKTKTEKRTNEVTETISKKKQKVEEKVEVRNLSLSHTRPLSVFVSSLSLFSLHFSWLD
jgi:hypothetical protein